VRRLSNAALAALPYDVTRPNYDRASVATGVVHLGLGAFHRAHQAVVFENAIIAGDPRWGVLGVSLRSSGVRDEIMPQDGLYSLVERDGTSEPIRVIGVVKTVLVAPDDPAAVVAALARPDTHLVTLTITEKGYKLRGDALDVSDPDVAHDLADLSAPRTAPGFLAAGLAARREAGRSPFTAISCDNLPHNGLMLREAVLAIAGAHDAKLAEWIARNGAFPQTMVDRIVPASTAADIGAAADRLGLEDRALVKTEPFFQWVIEDHFCSPRPAFETLGVQLTDDVAPWEEAKLRLLNGAHSGMAYLGGLAEIAFVHQFVADARGRRFVETLWQESAATLTSPAVLDLDRYRAELMTRFSNPALQHRTRQIAMDGSQKLPQRLLAPIAARRARGLSVETLALTVAAWMRWQSGIDDSGARFTVDDPLASITADALSGRHDPGDQVDALLAIEPIFPSALAADAVFRETLVRHLTGLRDHGAWTTLGEATS
jgi:fructuronate reductase